MGVMRTKLVAAVLILSSLALLPPSATAEPQKPELCLDWDTGDSWCFLDDCVFKSDWAGYGVICYSIQDLRVCAARIQHVDRVCLTV